MRIILATREEFQKGMSAQHKACSILNEFFNSHNINYIAEETDEQTDKDELS